MQRMLTSGGPDMDLEELGLTTTRSRASLSDARREPVGHADQPGVAALILEVAPRLPDEVLPFELHHPHLQLGRARLQQCKNWDIENSRQDRVNISGPHMHDQPTVMLDCADLSSKAKPQLPVKG